MKYIIFCVISITLFISCNKSIQTTGTLEVIPVQVENATELDISQARLIPLETNESSLLYDINSLDILNGNYIIQSRKKVLVFDSIGNFLYKVGSIGQGPKEYTSLSSFFIKDSELYFHDSNIQKIRVYNPQGDYLRSITPLPKNPEDSLKRYIPGNIIPFGKDKYLVKPMYVWQSTDTPVAMVYDAQFNPLYKIKGLYQNTTITLKAAFAYSPEGKEEAICWKLMNDTIYRLEHQTFVPKYVPDFGEHSIPQSIKQGKSVDELLQKSNNPEFIARYAALVGYGHYDEDHLYFTFVYNRAAYLVIYNTENKQTTCYGLPHRLQDHYRLETFLKVTDTHIYLALDPKDGSEDNPSLLVFNKTSLVE